MIRIYKHENEKPLYEIYINIRSKSGRRVQKKIRGFKSTEDAKRAEAKILREAERDLIEKDESGETWKFVVDKFEEYVHTNSRLKNHTKLDYTAAIRKHTEGFNKLAMKSISRADAKLLFQELTAKGLSIGHQKKMKIILNQLHSFAVEERYLDEAPSPFRHVQFEKEIERVPEILSIDQIKRLLRTAKGTNHAWYPVWAVALLTGRETASFLRFVGVMWILRIRSSHSHGPTTHEPEALSARSLEIGDKSQSHLS